MKIAVITGASSGLGREFALAADRTGYYDQIWLIARNVSKLQNVSDELLTDSKVITLDLKKEESWDKYDILLKEAKADIELLINSAGYGRFCKYDTISFDDSMGMIDLNCRALMAITLKSIPYMPVGSNIIQMASAASFQPLPYMNIYAATKAFVLSYSRALNSELKERGITVTACCPYWVRTNFLDNAKISGTYSFVKKYDVVADPRKVAEKAINDTFKRKDKSSYGVINRIQQVASKIAPYSLVEYLWKLKQGLLF